MSLTDEEFEAAQEAQGRKNPNRNTDVVGIVVNQRKKLLNARSVVYVRSEE
jgi:hypothetical protein